MARTTVEGSGETPPIINPTPIIPPISTASDTPSPPPVYTPPIVPVNPAPTGTGTVSQPTGDLGVVVTTNQKEYDPLAEDFRKTGMKLAMLGQYTNWMRVIDFSLNHEGEACARGFALGYYQGNPQTDGSLVMDGVRYYWKDLASL
jgi:hypothetical protein